MTLSTSWRLHIRIKLWNFKNNWTFVILAPLNMNATSLQLNFKLLFSRQLLAEIQTFNLAYSLSTGSLPITCKIKYSRTEMSLRSYSVIQDVASWWHQPLVIRYTVDNSSRGLTVKWTIMLGQKRWNGYLPMSFIGPGPNFVIEKEKFTPL